MADPGEEQAENLERDLREVLKNYGYDRDAFGELANIEISIEDLIAEVLG